MAQSFRQHSLLRKYLVKWHIWEVEAGKWPQASKFKVNHGKEMFWKSHPDPKNVILSLERPPGFCKTLHRSTEKGTMFISLLMGVHCVFFQHPTSLDAQQTACKSWSCKGASGVACVLFLGMLDT